MYNVALCKVNFWRATFPMASPPSSPKRGRVVGQPRSGRLRRLPTAAPRTPVFPKPHPEDLAKPDNRASLRSLRAVTLFASKKSAPRQPSAPCKQALIAGERLASWRQIALPEYRQGEYSGSRPALPCSSLKPTTKTHPSTSQRTSRGGAVGQRRSAGSTRCRLPPLADNHT